MVYKTREKLNDAFAEMSRAPRVPSEAFEKQVRNNTSDLHMRLSEHNDFPGHRPSEDRAHERIDRAQDRAMTGPTARLLDVVEDQRAYREPLLPSLRPSREEARAIRAAQQDNDNER